jgi:hypothetical protein
MSYNHDIDRIMRNISGALNRTLEECREFRATCHDFSATGAEIEARLLRPLCHGETVEAREADIFRRVYRR